MSNGPLGGFMPTPPAPSQPPQVKVDTTADSRGNFNNFLKNMNSAAMFTPPIAPLGLGSGMPSAIQPTINPMNDIDIFNQPVQMMFNGGEAEDFSDFAGFEDSSDPFGGGGGQDSFQDSGNDEQIIGTPVDISQEVAALPDVFTGTDAGMFSDDPSSATPMGLAMPSGQNLGSKLPTINFNQKAIQNALSQFPDANRYAKGDIESVLQDFAKNNDIVGALDYFQKDSLDGDKVGLGEKVVNSIIQASNVNPSAFSASAFNQIMPNEADKILNLGKGVDELLREGEIAQNFRNKDYNLPSDISLNNLIAATTPGTRQYKATRGGDLSSIKEGGSPFSPNPLMNRILQEDEITQNFRNRDYELPSNISLNDLIAATTPGTRLYEATKGDDLSMFKGDPFDPNPLNDRILQSEPGSDMRGGRRDPFDSGLRGSLQTGTSQDVIDTAKNAIRASAGNNMAIDNLVSQFGSLDPSIAELAGRTKRGVGEIGEIRPGDVEDLSGTPTKLFTGKADPFVGPDLDALQSFPPIINEELLNVTEKDKVGFDTVPKGARIFGGKKITNLPTGATTNAVPVDGVTTSVVPETYEENVGRAFSPERMAEIERLENVPVGQTQAGKGTDPTFLESQGFPTPLTFVGDLIERKNRERMATDIALGRPQGFFEGLGGFTAKPAGSMQEYMKYAQPNYSFGDTSAVSKSIPESQLVRGNTGRVTGIKDARGNLVTGVSPDENMFQDDGSEEIIRRKLLPVAAKEEDAVDSVPNVFGGTSPSTEVATVPTVVASPFAPSSAKINPVTFNTGDLNKLIEMLTGVAAKPIVSAQKGGVIGMANGGLIKAVDDFLAAS